ncbi:hypothetical protein PIROE2DRAFT_8796 [Piromyces sp. E2]|nr:hypothetical protein PIROE2DRAFT_8796 [Piromyces sp. E2]|eukprot:OUM64408.1 hypothetical protein PIROE2DRAFT_8796 [Piromyces sp. E2]
MMFNKRLLVEFKETRGYMAAIVLVQWIMLGVNVVITGATAKLLGNLFNNQSTGVNIYYYIIVIVVSVILRSILTRVNGTFSYYAASNVKSKMRSLIYQKLVRIGMDYKDCCPSSEVVQLSTEGVEHLDIYFGKYIPQFFYSMLAPITLFIVVSFIYFKAAIILLICVPLIPISIAVVQTFAKKLLDKYWGIYTDLSDTFLENLQGLTTTKIYNADEFYAKKMHKDSEKFRNVTMHVLIMQLNSVSIMDIVAYGGSAIGILLSVVGFLKGHISISQCYFIIMISAEFFLPMRLLGSYFHIAMNGNSTADRIFKMLDIPERTDNNGIDSSDDNERNGIENYSSKVETITGENDTAIEFNKVSFSYKDSDKKALFNISLTIPKHSIVALVGKSGCGKSTIASLIMGEHLTYDGEIQIDGHNRRCIEEKACMQHITRIVHDNFLFAGTLFDNLLMGFPKEIRDSIDTTNQESRDNLSEKMYQALREVRIYSFVMASGGLSMKIEANASNLSGGQKQRIALARAILQDSDVYIFDEATSNIDVESEKKIMQAIYNLAKNKTILIISHRLANVVNADKILMMEEGQIVQQGTHEELMAQTNSPYHQLYQRQQELEQYTKLENFEFNNRELLDEEEYDEEVNLPPSSSSSSSATPHLNFTTSGKSKKLHVRHRSNLNIMLGLTKLVKPLTGWMLLAIFLGCLGHFSAIFITILGGYGMKSVIEDKVYHKEETTSLTLIFILLCGLAIVRGFLRYGEQACNHYIAFRILADIRDVIFDALRRLAPAKLEGKGKGHFISMITSDTELLEVFYAHTISPIMIAIITSAVMICYIGRDHWLLALIAFCCYVIVGVVIPLINSRLGGDVGLSFREGVADLNTVVLDNLRGMREILQYRYQKEREVVTASENNNLRKLEKRLKVLESRQAYISNSAIILGGAVSVIVVSALVKAGKITFESGLLSIIALMSSFGPTIAISALSNDLNQTLACGERVMDLLEEEPLVPDNKQGKAMTPGHIHFNHVSFSYPKTLSSPTTTTDDSKKELLFIKTIQSNGKESDNVEEVVVEKEEEEEEEEEERILHDYSNEFEKGKITGIIGKSGCGKSTLLKLLMRFYDIQEGSILYEETPIHEINSHDLRQAIAYVTQETYLFHDTIANNIKLAKLDATQAEIENACRMAAIHDFIRKLPKGYDTKLAELGDSLSGGERQRLGMARAFLSGANIFLLDEPTSNLDSLNEAILLKSLKEQTKNKTIILVSHRPSTMAITDTLYKM